MKVDGHLNSLFQKFGHSDGLREAVSRQEHKPLVTLNVVSIRECMSKEDFEEKKNPCFVFATLDYCNGLCTGL